MKASLRFEHTPQPREKIKRRRRRKMNSPEQPMVQVVNVQEKENPIASKWVSPQFDIHNQTPAEQWPRKARRVKVTDIFKNDLKKPQGHKERRTLGTMQNLRFHGGRMVQEKICGRRIVDKQLPRSRPEQCITEVENPVQREQLIGREQRTQVSFSSEFVHGSSQNVLTDEVSVNFRPALASTPCTKKSSTPCTKKSMVLLKDTTKPLDIPDPSPNVFRWCDDVFGALPVEHQCIRSTEAKTQLSPLKTPDPQSRDINAMQMSFEKLLCEQGDADHISSVIKHTNCTDTFESNRKITVALPNNDGYNSAEGDDGKENVTEDKLLSVLAFDTPTHHGDYVMPYTRAST